MQPPMLPRSLTFKTSFATASATLYQHPLSECQMKERVSALNAPDSGKVSCVHYAVIRRVVVVVTHQNTYASCMLSYRPTMLFGSVSKINANVSMRCSGCEPARRCWILLPNISRSWVLINLSVRAARIPAI